MAGTSVMYQLTEDKQNDQSENEDIQAAFCPTILFTSGKM